MEKEKVYNPFKREYWRKENLLNVEQYEKAKQEFRSELNKPKKEKNDLGKKISKFGWKLTLVITVPLILTALFGVAGALVGGILALIVLLK